MNGGRFGMPAEITYIDHRTRGKMLSEKFGINPDAIGGKANPVKVQNASAGWVRAVAFVPD